MVTTSSTDVYYDPYDVDIYNDPYPTFRRLREEAPLYYNEQYDFYALSRHADVLAASLDWQTYSSARGTVLEFIRNDIQFPPGMAEEMSAEPTNTAHHRRPHENRLIEQRRDLHLLVFRHPRQDGRQSIFHPLHDRKS